MRLRRKIFTLVWTWRGKDEVAGNDGMIPAQHYCLGTLLGARKMFWGHRQRCC